MTIHEISPPAAAPPRATRREWIGLGVIALPCLLYSMDLTVLNLAVPHLTADLAPSSAELLWIIDIYGFMVAGALIVMGTLGDRIGRRKLLLLGATAFGAVSVAAAFASSAGQLIAARALLGLAGATLAPSTLSLIRNMFLDERQRTFAIGVWTTSFSVGAAIGPVLGGIVLEFFSWGAVFLLAVPVMALLLLLGPRLLPEFKDPGAGRLDVASAAMSLAAILLVIYGLKRAAEHGAETAALASVAAGLVVGFAFVRRQRRLADPLVDLGLFRARAFSAALATNLIGLFAAGGILLFTAQYLQLVLGLSPLRAGLWSVPPSLGFVAGSMFAPVSLRLTRRAYAMASGLVMSAVGFTVLTQVSGPDGLLRLAGGMALFAFGLAVAVTLSTDLIVGTAPPERAGAAASLSETAAELGGALGIAVLGSVGIAAYRRTMADGMPAALPPDAAEAARRTLGGAVAAAERLPAGLGGELLATARDAFGGAMGLTAAIAAGIALATAAMAAVMLRDVRPRGE